MHGIESEEVVVCVVSSCN